MESIITVISYEQVRSNKDASEVTFVRSAGLLDWSDISDLSISAIKKTRNGPTDRPTDGQTFI